jgi:hypothetical protein
MGNPSILLLFNRTYLQYNQILWWKRRRNRWTEHAFMSYVHFPEQVEYLLWGKRRMRENGAAVVMK